MTTIGLCLPQLGPHVDRACVRAFCQEAEALGFGALWVQEHMMYPLDSPWGYHRTGVSIPDQYRSVFAPLELLSFAAAWTARPAIGTSVLVAGYHRPVEVATRLATIDQLSGGRLIAGFSVGWSREEHAQMDVDFATRGARSAELIEAIQTCWGPDPVEFKGEFFAIPKSSINPKPLQRPRPVLLSGMASDAGLERTARLFDAWNPSGSAQAVAARAVRLNQLRTTGKPPLDVHLRVFVQSPPNRTALIWDPETMVREAAAAKALGMAGVIIDCNFWDRIKSPSDWAATPHRIAQMLGDVLIPPTSYPQEEV